MKVSIGTKLKKGPYGGGNQFAIALCRHLERRQVEVSFDLNDPDLDVILLTEPRAGRPISAFSDRDVLRYLLGKNRRVIVVHRINDSDESRGTLGVNRRLMRANRVGDHTVWVSEWLKDLFAQQGFGLGPSTVIRNGSDRSLFHSRGFHRWDRCGPLRLVTHHWSTNGMKGFDLYPRLDDWVATGPFAGEISFTYIGRLPEAPRLRNTVHAGVLHGEGLADALRDHHLYVTAALNEAGANHPNEGACCGLPLLYRESGCLPEYCQGYGLSFTAEDLEQKLQEMMDRYEGWADRMPEYPHSSERMGEEYLALFERLLDERTRILERRELRRDPVLLFQAFLPELPFQRTAASVLEWLRKSRGSSP